MLYPCLGRHEGRLLGAAHVSNHAFGHALVNLLVTVVVVPTAAQQDVGASREFCHLRASGGIAVITTLPDGVSIR